MTTVWALFVGVADGFDAETPTLQVVIVALISEEFSMTQLAEGGWLGELTVSQGSFSFDEIGTVFSFTGGTPFTLAGMMDHIVMIEPSIAFVAEIGLAEESFEGIASIVMVIFLDESDDLARRHGRVSYKDQHVRGIDGHDFDLILGQGGLKLSEFGETAGSFGNSCKPVKFLGLLFLDGTALFEIVIIRVSSIPVNVSQSFHGDDGASTAEIVFILDGDAGLFHNTLYSGTTRFVAFTVPTAGTWGTYEGGLHGEGIVGGKLFVGVQFARKGLEIRVQSFTAFFEFAYSEGGGLEGVGEGTGLHGKVYSGVRCQGSVRGNLLLDGPLEGTGEFLPQIIVRGDLPALPQGSLEPLSVQYISPVSTRPNGL